MSGWRGFGLILGVVLVMANFYGCAGSRKNDPGVIARSQRVQTTLGEISAALLKYHSEHGFFPEGLATLRELNYIRLLPDLEREWTFTYFVDGDTVTQVEAISTATMLDGAGYKIIYRAPENQFEGYGVTTWP